MEKVYKLHEDYDRTYTLNDKTDLLYFSKKKMKEHNPNHKYIVIGAIGKGLCHHIGEILIDEKTCPYYPLHYSKLCYGVNGYIDCGNDEYIAIVEERRMKHFLLFLLAIAILVGLIFGGMSLLKDKLDLDKNISDYRPNVTLPNGSDPNSIAIPGYDAIRMLEETDEMFVALWNPETNPCYFKFTIVLEDTKEVLYESGLVPPGKAITTVKLNKKMKAGTYPILVQMDTFSLEDEKPLNGGTSKTVIEVVNE